MDQKTIEELLDEMIEKAGKAAINEMTKEDLKHLEDAYPYEISKEHEKKMKQIFKEAGYVNEDENRVSNTISTTGENKDNANKFTPKKYFVIVAAAVLVFAFAIGGVSAWRESFVNCFFDKKDEYSDVKGSGKSKEYYVDNIYFKYIPSEYEVKNKEIEGNIKMITFENKNHNYISIDIQKDVYYPQINTESGDIEELIINDKDMVYFERGDFKFLSWREKDCVYTLETNDIKRLLLKIAENIEILDDMSQ